MFSPNLQHCSGKSRLRTGMCNNVCNCSFCMQEEDFISVSHSRRNPIVICRQNCNGTDIAFRHFLKNPCDCQHRTNCTLIVRWTDDHFTAFIERAAFQGARIKDVHRSTENTDVFRIDDVTVDALLHLITIHLTCHNDAAGTFFRSVNQI